MSTATTLNPETLLAMGMADLRALAKQSGVTTSRGMSKEDIVKALSEAAVTPNEIPAKPPKAPKGPAIDDELHTKLVALGATIEIRGGRPFAKLSNEATPEQIEEANTLVEGTKVKVLFEGQTAASLNNKKQRKPRPSKVTFEAGGTTRSGAKIVSVDVENKKLVIECTEADCGETREIHYQDAFQVSRCDAHQKAHVNRNRSAKAKLRRQRKAAEKAAQAPATEATAS